MDNQPYASTSSSGFIRLSLNRSFGHEKFTNEKTLALIDIASNGHTKNLDYNYDARSLPLDPYNPQIAQIELNYTSAEVTPGALFHVYPFGHNKISTDSGRLFPDLPYQGELYLGIGDLEPPQRLTLLFQCAEGTANPLKEEGAILWHYLKGNDWIAFKEQDIDDKTNNLSGSGIIGIAMPEEADTEHDLLASGLHWLRLAVVGDADALNSLISIDAQAATATILDQGNAADFLGTPLAAGTISKLKISDASIKKIKQPAESFGGQPPESDDHFYTRASERLRHKDRAAAVWDYEHLILEAFPEIYKVKCINHTELCRDLANNIIADNELKPGHVLVVTIPYITEESAVDPLRPYTRKQTLVAVDAFLRSRYRPSSISKCRIRKSRRYRSSSMSPSTRTLPTSAFTRMNSIWRSGAT
ncbi:MAG: baseplate J/gp47 family protein [Deltaproteobacteria bacterium]|nr:baseplate J/gp47 family protein [Deltaproteobacteria bacterium]